MSDFSKDSENPYYYNKVAVAVVRNPEGKVLIVKRKRELESITGGKLTWTFPGGSIKDAVKLSEGAIRHTLEQAGYTVSVKSKISERTYHPFKNQLTYFECEMVEGAKTDPVSPDVEASEWVLPEELNKYFSTNIDLGVAAFLGL